MSTLKLVLVIVLCLVTIACSKYSRLEITKGEYLCRDAGGVYKFDRIVGIICKTGKAFSRNTAAALVIPVDFINKEHK